MIYLFWVFVLCPSKIITRASVCASSLWPYNQDHLAWLTPPIEIIKWEFVCSAYDHINKTVQHDIHPINPAVKYILAVDRFVLPSEHGHGTRPWRAHKPEAASTIPAEVRSPPAHCCSWWCWLQAANRPCTTWGVGEQLRTCPGIGIGSPATAAAWLRLPPLGNEKCT